ncbi:HEPN domain-containing protein [Candidatus Bipolaricaulota bacterium]|nr:HEPN domain-containing protein [Candidatus Bipolaricaulota bacterium]MBS3814891.1 HEPN domain-containing protein [Candidatus Bipolaricaulota bacterium]
MSTRAKDWLVQSKKDLEQAKSSREAEHHEWACFIAQQGSEKAVKALHLSKGQQAWGHTVAKLIQELPAEVQPGQEMIEKAKVLDSFYVPTRYPNGHPEGAPFEHFGPLQSEEAINYASEIIEFVSNKMASREGS